MCGITGGWWNNKKLYQTNSIEKSIERIKHRGPDDNGMSEFLIKEGVLKLAHTRLSIIDLTKDGHQPKTSICKDYTITFNGEIYNYKELREELKYLGHNFKTETDTEVLIESYIEWGEKAMNRFIGMFAFVIYNKKDNSIFCARDAFGIKPFFYDLTETSFLFSSEIQSLICLRNKKTKLNYQVSYDYLVTNNYDNTENTFIEGIKHLKPGHFIHFSLKNNEVIKNESWFTIDHKKKTNISYEDAVLELREKFLESIKLHLRSDVKVGAALSGGIDSSAIVCAMRYVDPELEINTFSYIAENTPVDETKWIDLINSNVKAKVNKTYTNDKELFNELDKLIESQGEPFGSSSIYAQYKVFELAKEKGVVVTLEGQGADEMLAGYLGYPGYRLLSLVEKHKYLKAILFLINWSKWPGRNIKLGLRYFNSIYFSNIFYNAFRKLTKKDFPEWINKDELNKKGVQLKLKRAKLDNNYKGRRVIEKLKYALQKHGIPHLVRHGDRNAMNFQIEGRVPFLNTKLVEYCLSLPEEYLISQNGETKHIFRDAMRGIVPEEVLDRKDKVGFATPEKVWIKNMSKEIRLWLEESEKISFLNKEIILKEFDLIINDQKKYSWLVWRWINFVRWYKIMEIEE